MKYKFEEALINQIHNHDYIVNRKIIQVEFRIYHAFKALRSYPHCTPSVLVNFIYYMYYISELT